MTNTSGVCAVKLAVLTAWLGCRIRRWIHRVDADFPERCSAIFESARLLAALVEEGQRCLLFVGVRWDMVWSCAVAGTRHSIIIIVTIIM